MEHLNVNPAELLDVAGQYEQLSIETAGLPDKAAAELAEMIPTHGLIGYPSMVGIGFGMVKQAAKMAAKSVDYQNHAQKFTEHAATYKRTDVEAGADQNSITF
ncbi:Protein of uncharacterised function (DUF2580) [Mycobacteroides abscessus subsp. abscessus]|uniref:type VII secretion target n=1 Tax=Mycobacteroides abscessus TaxID=36809 RepID=UPI0009296E01|nr:type VII secretion target [Mycobacteroides abscessus]SIJ21825.1 Protein of uncharacterised function (DUF2580) [Mycobacteroides abscessus subsp. abscessus]SLH38747.1 Protein of uncharacterised function (DUF2580) [Mycobacteroides abscessus subsp. abscessus]